ncbi:uncharacterized protein LOC141632081 [Silene latifolia]|uniref:uncharacterized protein LOC141632081 n=1 Tax=Silene latifolia TaxID=37657 RepID=UPI003D770934
MTLYDGTEDPLDHINQYKQKMMVVAATGPEKEACMCKGFASTLLGAVLQWFVNLPNKSISSFAGCDPTTAFNAFRRGLHRDSDLYKDLTKHPCATFKEVKQMVEATYRLEEDEDRRDLYGIESSSRKIITERKNERVKPYNKNTVNKVSGEIESTEAPPKLSEYGFTTGLAGVMKAIRELGQRVRRPKKPIPRENDRRDASKRCEYHNDIGHNTEDCVVLRKKVKHLYSAERLDHLLPKGAKSGKFNTTDQAQPSPPPPYSKVTNVITGGSEICVSLIQQQSAMQPRLKKINKSSPSGSAYRIYQQSHSTRQTYRKLCESDNAGNIEDGFSEKDMVKKAGPLVGFSGETKQSLGEIVVPTFAGSMNKHVRYLVIDGPSTYNVILDRPWIHEIKAVPSTYH